MRINGHNDHLALFSPAQREKSAVAVKFTHAEPAESHSSGPAPERDSAVQDAYLFMASQRVVARVADGLDKTAEL